MSGGTTSDKPLGRQILHLLAEHGPQTTLQLAAHLGRTPHQTSALTTHLAGATGRRAIRSDGCAPRAGVPGGPSRIWVITDAGRLLLAADGARPLQAGAIPHLTLGRACAVPMTARELWEAVCDRYGQVSLRTVKEAARQLCMRDLLANGEPVPTFTSGPPAHTYVLTPAGEDMLTRLPRPA